MIPLKNFTICFNFSKQLQFNSNEKLFLKKNNIFFNV